MTPGAEVVAIGDELVHGANLDTNSRWLARELEAVGVAVLRFTVVGDDPRLLAAALQQAGERADLVVTTGGLGPTLDDRTRDVVAELLGGPLWFDADSWTAIQQHLQRRGRPVPASNRRQAEFPPGALVLGNPVGTAPGFRVRLQRATLFALPGVPREMQRLWRDHVLPHARALPGLQPHAQHCLRVVGPPEALLGERIAEFMLPGRAPAVGITASGGLLTIRIVGSGPSADAAAAACAATAAELRPRLGDWLIAEGDAELPELAAARLLQHGVTLALAESCTGGGVAARLTDVPGISAVLRGGVVSYADAVKVGALGVDAALLAAHGAVSEPVAAAMAEGAAQRLGARLGIAVTGVAGPGGGSAAKPVGTTCFATAFDGAVRAWTLRLPDFGRAFVRERAALEVWTAILRLLPG
jgi:nicotinamide-nucleotide amidase